MYHRNTYTNTGNAKAVIGSIFLTFALTATILYTPQICEGIHQLAIKGKDKAEELMHSGKKPYAVCARTNDGRIFDTGQRIWK